MKGRFEMLAVIGAKERALTLGLRDGCAERCVCLKQHSVLFSNLFDDFAFRKVFL